MGRTFIVFFMGQDLELSTLRMFGRDREHVRSWALTNPRVLTIINVTERVV